MLTIEKATEEIHLFKFCGHGAAYQCIQRFKPKPKLKNKNKVYGVLYYYAERLFVCLDQQQAPTWDELVALDQGGYRYQGEDYNSLFNIIKKLNNVVLLKKDIFVIDYLNTHYQYFLPSNQKKSGISKFFAEPYRRLLKNWRLILRESNDLSEVVAIEDHNYMTDGANVWVLDHYVQQLQDIFGISNLVKQQVNTYCALDGAVSVSYYYMPLEKLLEFADKLLEKQMQPLSLKEIAIHQLNKVRNPYQQAQWGDISLYDEILNAMKVKKE